jgi:uncharacterized protein YciI
LVALAYRIQPARPGLLAEGPTERETAIVAEHFQYLKDLAAQGVVLMAGRTTEPNDQAFGIVVFLAETQDRAAALMAGDPAVAHGVMRAERFPFRIVLSAPAWPMP